MLNITGLIMKRRRRRRRRKGEDRRINYM